jgi:hypothetical protein
MSLCPVTSYGSPVMSCNRAAQAGYVAFSLVGARCYTCEFFDPLGGGPVPEFISLLT